MRKVTRYLVIGFSIVSPARIIFRSFHLARTSRSVRRPPQATLKLRSSVDQSRSSFDQGPELEIGEVKGLPDRTDRPSRCSPSYSAPVFSRSGINEPRPVLINGLRVSLGPTRRGAGRSLLDEYNSLMISDHVAITADVHKGEDDPEYRAHIFTPLCS